MVTIRESPHAHRSPAKSEAQWPPKSPFQALLSSPSGRKKWQDRGAVERSVSPSPVKSSKTLPREMSVSESESEDEETLQLELKAIEARLKLKKLRARKKTEGGGSSESKENSARRQPEPQKSRADVEVPLSPVKSRKEPPPSPARVRLGLPPQMKADGVSLKRARYGAQINRGARDEDVFGAAKSATSSFSERLAKGRTEVLDKEAKARRLEGMRSKGFAGMQAGTRGGDEATRPSSAQGRPTASKVDSGVGISRSASTRSARSDTTSRPHPNRVATTQARPSSQATSRHSNDDVNSHTNSPPPSSDSSQSTSGYDPISSTHLSKRNIPHPIISRALDSKEPYTLPRLLKEVKAPTYEPPDCESDFVVFAILASKSSPFDQKPTHKTSDQHQPQQDAEAPRNKFMVLHLTDLQWEIDCFLFGSAFDQFWKLTPGTLLAILNPSILPPKGNQDSGRFSLKLSSSEDCIMEIGTARDLAYCSSVRKDGKVCGQWVDGRKTEICEFHLNLMVDRERKNNMAVNGMWRGFGPGSGGGERHKPNSQSREKDGFMNKKKGGPTYHREYGTLYSVPGTGASAANLLDAEDKILLSEEASRNRIAAAQRERDLARKLGALGDSVGSAYFRSKNKDSSDGVRSRDIDAERGRELFEKPSASELGLLGKKACEQRLSPGKERRKHFGIGAISTSGVEAIGWGGAGRVHKASNARSLVGKAKVSHSHANEAKRPGIVRARSEEGSLSPKKRARFALEKGIREPGRESLGEVLEGREGGEEEEDDDDELEIV